MGQLFMNSLHLIAVLNWMKLRHNPNIRQFCQTRNKLGYFIRIVYCDVRFEWLQKEGNNPGVFGNTPLLAKGGFCLWAKGGCFFDQNVMVWAACHADFFGRNPSFNMVSYKK